MHEISHQPDFCAYRQALCHRAWRSGEQGLPQGVAPWLLHPDSLTEKMQQYCTALLVELVNEGWQSAGANCSLNSTACWVREVQLWGDTEAWIFAQTFIPQETVENVAQGVLTLGEKPIGLWLFPQNPQRQGIQWRWDEITQCFARRSCFTLKGYPLEIRELFLPQFPFDRQSVNVKDNQ
ncbi:hypothetical protein A4G19_03955 [Pasteurellaceae bacterium Macca]|nr:hypothetical protein [Pasteurellaceae bacterium Macca]